MQAAEIFIVQETLEGLLAQGEELAHKFRALFNERFGSVLQGSSSIGAGDQAVAVTLATIVSELQNPHRVTPILKQLAREYLAPDPTALAEVADLITEVLEDVLGPTFSGNQRSAWTSASSMLIDLLSDGDSEFHMSADAMR